MDELSNNTQKIDVFFCVHDRSVGPMLAASIRSYQINFPLKADLHFVTNNAAHLQRFLGENFPDLRASVTPDEALLSRREQTLTGWFRQQVIKLRAYEFWSTQNFCNLGADTLLLGPISSQDILEKNYPILYFSRRPIPDIHTLFELRRIRHVSNILKVFPTKSLRYIDFINDFFCFNADSLRQLNATLHSRYGSDPYATLLSGLDPHNNQTRFGEWTLYSMFILDVLHLNLEMRNATSSYLEQIHSSRNLNISRFNSKVVHIVNKDFDWQAVRALILRNRADLEGVF